jgi:uncharacterized protein YoxC
MGIISVGILFCAIAFAMVVIYICFVLKRVSNTIGTMGTTLDDVDEKMQDITPRLLQTIRETDHLIDDVDDKLKATDSVFDSIENTGASLQSLNQAYAHSAKQLSDVQFQEITKPFVEGMKWSEAALYLYAKWKKDGPVRSNRANENNTEKEG